MIRKIRKIILACILSVSFIGSTINIAAISDNDGSAFITKAEFDALKSAFQANIDSYNKSIDSKIDNAIASYLSGISFETEEPVNPLVPVEVEFLKPSWLLAQTRQQGATALTGMLYQGTTYTIHNGCKGTGKTYQTGYAAFYNVYERDTEWGYGGEIRGHCYYYEKKKYGGTEYNCSKSYWRAIRSRIWESYSDMDSRYSQVGECPKLKTHSTYTELGSTTFDFEDPSFATYGGDATAVGCYMAASDGEYDLDNKLFYGAKVTNKAQYVRQYKYRYIYDEEYHTSTHNDQTSGTNTSTGGCAWNNRTNGQKINCHYMRYKSETSSDVYDYYGNLSGSDAACAVKMYEGLPLYSIKKNGTFKFKIKSNSASYIQLKIGKFTTSSDTKESCTKMTNLTILSSGASFSDASCNYVYIPAGTTEFQYEAKNGEVLYLKPTQACKITSLEGTLKIVV